MTTIAYRDGLLAVDSMLSCNGHVCGDFEKSFTAPDGSVAALAGRASDSVAFRRWVEAGCVGDLPRFTDDDIDGVLVRPDGSVFYVVAVDKGEPGALLPVKAPFVAAGSGTRYALGAMAMGADAMKAVEIAMQFDATTGGPIALKALPGRFLRR